MEEVVKIQPIDPVMLEHAMALNSKLSTASLAHSQHPITVALPGKVPAQPGEKVTPAEFRRRSKKLRKIVKEARNASRTVEGVGS